MKKVYLYAGIGAWLFFMLIIALAVVGGANNAKTEKLDSKSFEMNEIAIHPLSKDENIAVKVTKAEITFDEKTPKVCYFGSCIDNRKAGMNILTVTMEITNLAKEPYIDDPSQFELEDANGKKYSHVSRSIDMNMNQISKGETYSTQIRYDVIPPVSSYDLLIKPYWVDVKTIIHLNGLYKLLPSLCEGTARCFGGFVTNIVDGDTLDALDIETNQTQRIRLSLVDTPEKGDLLFDNAKDFTAGFCPVDSYLVFDEDDGQTEGSYERIIGKVFCEGELLNENLLEHDLAKIDSKLCTESEYGNELWAIQNGC
jgi:hypothetical protein